MSVVQIIHISRGRKLGNGKRPGRKSTYPKAVAESAYIAALSEDQLPRLLVAGNYGGPIDEDLAYLMQLEVFMSMGKPVL